MTNTAQELTAVADARIDAARTAADALQVFADLGFDPTDDERDGIRSLDIVKDKDALIGVQFLALRWRFNEGEMGTFVSIECMMQDGTILVLNDGSTGIRDQFAELSEHREKSGHPSPFAGRMVRRGLRRSDYTVEDPKTEKPIPATTYYVQF